MSDSESDIEMKSALHKMERKKPPPPSPSDDLKNKKVTTKMMITDALIVLRTRKGVSLYAIKKFLTEKYSVDTEKLNYLIKKSIKAGVDDGTFIQMKGVGASGSFKLANVKEKPKPKKNTDKSKDKSQKSKKIEKSNDEIPKEAKKPKKMEIKKKEDAVKSKKKVEGENSKSKKKNDELKSKKKNVEPKLKKLKSDKPKKSKAKIAEGMQTPAKKRAAMMKRKSIGTIIKPPKMKPKAQ